LIIDIKQYKTNGKITKVQSNADVVRNMADKDLAQFLDDVQRRVYEEENKQYTSVIHGWLEWLRAIN